MNCAKFFILLLVSCACLLPGCKESFKQEPTAPRVLATVNGVPITEDEVALRLGNHEDLLDPAAKEKALDGVIAEELMYQKARKLGFDMDQKFQSDVRQLEMKVTMYKRTEMARRVRDTQIASHVTVTDGDVREYYAKHAEEITTDLHLGVLQFRDAATAKQALGRIRSGTPFEKVAFEQFTGAPKEKKRAWDNGFLHWEQVPAPFTDEVYRLKRGEVSEVLSNGREEAYLVKVMDRRKNSDAIFDRERQNIENRLWALKGKAAYESYIADLKRGAAIRKNAMP